MLIPTVQPFFLAIVLSLEEEWRHEPRRNVEILHRAQIGQNVYTEYVHTKHAGRGELENHLIFITHLRMFSVVYVHTLDGCSQNWRTMYIK